MIKIFLAYLIIWAQPQKPMSISGNDKASVCAEAIQDKGRVFELYAIYTSTVVVLPLEVKLIPLKCKKK